MKRSVLVGLALVCALGVWVSSPASGSRGVSVAAKPRPSLLFVLHARSGWATRRGHGHWRLSLTGVSSQTLEFSDRPDRIAKNIPTRKLVSEWKKLFVGSPPNGAFVVEHGAHGAPTAVELSRPRWEKHGRQLDICMCTIGHQPAARRWLAKLTRASVHRHGRITLFIDNSALQPVFPVIDGCVIQPQTICENANLSNADLTNADLFNADLTGANLTKANFTNAYLREAILADVTARGATFTGADLTALGLANGPDASGDFTGANFTKANLFMAQIDATLKGANFTNANFWGANVSGDLTNANLTNATNLNGDFTGAIFCHTTMPDGSINNSDC